MNAIWITKIRPFCCIESYFILKSHSKLKALSYTEVHALRSKSPCCSKSLKISLECVLK